jgi:hypothetical protein
MRALAIVAFCLATAAACIALIETASSIVRGLAG